MAKYAFTMGDGKKHNFIGHIGEFESRCGTCKLAGRLIGLQHMFW